MVVIIMARTETYLHSFTLPYVPLSVTHFFTGVFPLMLPVALCAYRRTTCQVPSSATLWHDWLLSSSPFSMAPGTNRSSTSTTRGSSNLWRSCLSRRYRSSYLQISVESFIGLLLRRFLQAGNIFCCIYLLWCPKNTGTSGAY